MYVSVKGGERAIDAAHDWLGRAHRGPKDQPALDTAQIRDQMGLAVARVMAEELGQRPRLSPFEPDSFLSLDQSARHRRRHKPYPN